jgi:hypothetical protein
MGILSHGVAVSATLAGLAAGLAAGTALAVAVHGAMALEDRR